MKFLQKLITETPKELRLKSSFSGDESIKHLSAKIALCNWLNQHEQKGTGDLYPFWWRCPGYGIHMELPFFTTSSPYYFEHSKGLKHPGKVGSFEQCFRNPKQLGEILFKPDITVFSNGTVLYMIEIVHTNPVNDLKLEKISKWAKWNSASFEVYEVKAEWISRQLSNVAPTSIKAKRIFEC